MNQLVSGGLPTLTHSQQALGRWAPPKQGSEPKKKEVLIPEATQEKGRRNSQDEGEAGDRGASQEHRGAA